MSSLTRNGAGLRTWMESWGRSRVEVAAARVWVRATRRRVSQFPFINTSDARETDYEPQDFKILCEYYNSIIGVYSTLNYY